MQEEPTRVEADAATPQVELDPVKVQEFRAQLERQQNLPAGIAAGLAAAIVGAIAWAAVTGATNYQIGYMAVGVGLFYGIVLYAGLKYSVRRLTAQEVQSLVKEKA